MANQHSLPYLCLILLWQPNSITGQRVACDRSLPVPEWRQHWGSNGRTDLRRSDCRRHAPVRNHL